MFGGDNKRPSKNSPSCVAVTGLVAAAGKCFVEHLCTAAVCAAVAAVHLPGTASGQCAARSTLPASAPRTACSVRGTAVAAAVVQMASNAAAQAAPFPAVVAAAAVAGFHRGSTAPQALAAAVAAACSRKAEAASWTAAAGTRKSPALRFLEQRRKAQEDTVNIASLRTPMRPYCSAQVARDWPAFCAEKWRNLPGKCYPKVKQRKRKVSCVTSHVAFWISLLDLPLQCVVVKL